MTTDTAIQEQGNISRKHSGFGIASFIIALVQGVITAVVVVAAGIFASMRSNEEQEVSFLIIGLVIILGIFVHIIGLVLGIVGAVQKNRKKVLTIIGLIINAFAVLIVVLLMIIGLIMG